MKLVIRTQRLENYGIGEGFDRWKHKGGNCYVMRDLTEGQIKAIASRGIPHLSEMINTKADGFQEYILSSRVVNDDVEECEPWETPWEINYSNKKGGWTANRFLAARDFWDKKIEGRWEGYVMGPNGARNHYASHLQAR